MQISDMLLPEFDQEMRTTRKVLERVPDGHDDFRPHAKSTTLSSLAAHVASLPRFGWLALQPEDVYDFNPPGGRTSPLPKFESAVKNVATFDEFAARTRESIAAASNELFGHMWTLQFGGKTLFTMPRVSALRMLMMNHLIHHRGQLSVYLRLNDVAVPQIYGPTADEPM